MRRILTALAVIALTCTTACGDPKPAAAPAPVTTSAAPAITATSEPAVSSDDYQSELACRLLRQATQGELSEPIDEDTVTAIADAASASSNAGIKFAGQMVADRHAVAVAAAGNEDEASTSIALQTATIKLETACIQAGFDD